MNISVYQHQTRTLNIMQKKPLLITECLNVWKPELLIEEREEIGRPDTDSLDSTIEFHQRRTDGLLHQYSIEEIHI